MSLLWIVPRWPLPAHDGASLATSRLVRAVARQVPVDLLVLAGEKTPEEEATIARALLVRSARAIPRACPTGNLRLARLALRAVRQPRLPLTVTPFADRALVAAVERFVGRRTWKTLVLEGVHVAGAFSPSGRFESPRWAETVVYRAQNVESELWERAARHEASFWKRIALDWQREKVARLETSLVKAGLVAAITETDAARFRALVPHAQIESIPFGVDFPDEPPLRRKKKHKAFLYCGRLDWEPNRQGLEWLLREVWPSVVSRSPSARLTIVGNGEASWLRCYTSLPGVRVRGYVPTTRPYLRGAGALLVPAFVASGVRVKMVEAARQALVCISTRLGARGTGLEPETHFIPAETRDEWIARLSGFDPARDARKGESAFHHLKRLSSLEDAGEKFLKFISPSLLQ